VLDRSAAAPLLSLAGLVVAAAFSLGLFFGRFDLGIGGGPGGEGGSRTPNPSVVFTPAPSPDATPAFVGTILFAQGGSIWSISGREVRRISSGSQDSMPAWRRAPVTRACPRAVATRRTSSTTPRSCA
jgi:hypothetical protein